MAYLAINTPHEEVFVKKEYLYDLEKGHGELTPGVWVSAKSAPCQKSNGLIGSSSSNSGCMAEIILS